MSERYLGDDLEELLAMRRLYASNPANGSPPESSDDNSSSDEESSDDDSSDDSSSPDDESSPESESESPNNNYPIIRRYYPTYGKCIKNHVPHLHGAVATDGCMQFIADDQEGATVCATCGCDKTFHELHIRSEIVWRGGAPPSPPAL